MKSLILIEIEIHNQVRKALSHGFLERLSFSELYNQEMKWIIKKFPLGFHCLSRNVQLTYQLTYSLVFLFVLSDHYLQNKTSQKTTKMICRLILESWKEIFKQDECRKLNAYYLNKVHTFYPDRKSTMCVFKKISCVFSECLEVQWNIILYKVFDWLCQIGTTASQMD